MKIIGIDSDGNYIAVISHHEVEKVVDKYYGKLNQLKPGQEFNLGAGHDFRSDIRSACSAMVTAGERFERSQSTLFKFAVMVGNLPSPEPHSEEA